jgi:hypothetical protein
MLYVLFCLVSLLSESESAELQAAPYLDEAG